MGEWEKYEVEGNGRYIYIPGDEKAAIYGLYGLLEKLKDTEKVFAAAEKRLKGGVPLCELRPLGGMNGERWYGEEAELARRPRSRCRAGRGE